MHSLPEKIRVFGSRLQSRDKGMGASKEASVVTRSVGSQEHCDHRLVEGILRDP